MIDLSENILEEIRKKYIEKASHYRGTFTNIYLGKRQIEQLSLEAKRYDLQGQINISGFIESQDIRSRFQGMWVFAVDDENHIDFS